jgi:Rv0078B-related antitoxin
VNAADPNSNYPAAPSGAAEVRDAVLVRGRTPDDDPSPEQIEIYRRMTPGRRLEIAEQMYWSARRMKAAWLRTQHPDWSDSEVGAEVTRIFSHARS